jgi:magnesium transporter
MADTDIQPITTIPDKPAETESFQRRWFCTAKSSDGRVFKGGAENIATLMDSIQSASIAWVDFVTEDVDFDTEALGAASQLGFSEQLLLSLHTKSYLNYQDFDNEMGMRMPTVQVKHFEVWTYPLLLLLKKNFILTIHPHSVDRRFTRLRRYSDTVLRKISTNASKQDKLTMLLIRITDENNDRNFEHLGQIMEMGDRLNASLIDANKPGDKIAPDIYHMRHAIITYLDALWDSVRVLHTLRYGDAELITDDSALLEKLGILAEDVNRQLSLAEHMSSVLASGLEVLQAAYNNQLQTIDNRLAKIMTYLAYRRPHHPGDGHHRRRNRLAGPGNFLF